jgi:hypothetical protein
MSSFTASVRPEFAGRALLVSSQAAEAKQIVGAMQRFAFTVDVCTNQQSGATLISKRKFQAIILDLGADDQYSELFDIVRFSPSNRSAVTFAVLGLERRSRPVQPNFFLHRPLTNALLASTIKAAIGLIIRDYRRYFRCPINVPATVQISGGPPVPCELMNISEGGLALNKCIPLGLGTLVRTRFELPDKVGAFQVEAHVCWSDNRSRAGLHFFSMVPDQKVRLQIWLSKQIEEGFPERIMQLFGNQR